MRALGFFLVLLNVSAQTYSIRTVAGTHYAGDGLPATSGILVQPEGIAFDLNGNLYIADAADSRVRKVDNAGRISTVAGDGVASSAGLKAPYDVCVDLAGNVYIADLGNARVRKITREGTASTIAGAGEIKLLQPRNVAVDARGTLYISDFAANRIYQVTPQGNFTFFAGTGEPGISEDGMLATQSKLSGPAGIAIDLAGNIYVADSGNRRVRRISGGIMTTLPVEFATPTSVAVDAALNLYVADGSSIITKVAPDGKIGFVSLNAGTVALDRTGRLFAVAGRRVHRVENTSIIPVAGTGFGGFAGDGGPSSEWRFSSPAAIARDASGDLYIADSGSGRVRQITNRGDLITLIGGLIRPSGLAFDIAGRLYVADAGSGLIHRYDNGVARLFTAGSEAKPFLRPSSLAFDLAGNLFVVDTGNNLIRKVTPAGVVTVAVGGGGSPEDTNPLRARLAAPVGIGFDSSGNMWFSETGTGWLRRLSPSGQLTTLKLDLKEPRGLKVAADGSVYVCEAGERRVLQVMPDGTWWPIAGSGESGISDAEMSAMEAPMMSPTDLWLGPAGRITLVDAGAGRIRELIPIEKVAPPPPPIVEPQPVFVLVNEEGTLNSFKDPAQRGSVVSIYGTGQDTGKIQAVVAIGGIEAEILYAGPAPGQSGVVQINARTPSGFAPSGILPLSITINGKSAQPGLTIVTR